MTEDATLGAESTPAPAAGAKPDPTFAWTIALLPLAWIPLSYLAPEIAASPVTSLAILGVTILLGALDLRRIQAAGFDLQGAWLLLIPGYLIVRTIRVGSTPAIPVVWFASFAASVLAMTTFAAVLQYDEAAMEGEIEAWMQDQGIRGATVDCDLPSAVRNGEEILCTATDRAGQAAAITVTFSADSYTWNWAS